MKLRKAPIFVLLGISCLALEQAWFRADTTEIPAGGSAVLNWHWAEATNGYLSSIGVIEHPSNGSVRVKPDQTTSYLLILEGPGGVTRTFTQRVVVSGAKGNYGDWPDLLEPLPYKREYQSSSISLVQGAAKVRKVLQDDLHFQLRQFQIEDQSIFATAWLQDSTLDLPNERTRKFRRVAYRVAVQPTPDHNLRFSISSAIQWRLAIDTRWFAENSSSSDLYSRHLGNLWDSLRKN